MYTEFIWARFSCSYHNSPLYVVHVRICSVKTNTVTMVTNHSSPPSQQQAAKPMADHKDQRLNQSPWNTNVHYDSEFIKFSICIAFEASSGI